MVTKLRHLPYDERLQRLGLTTLEVRRRISDIIEAFKILTGREAMDSEQFFTLVDKGKYNLRGHRMKLKVSRCRLDDRKCFFSRRVVNEWNTEHVIDAPSVNSIKNRLDRLLAHKDMSI